MHGMQALGSGIMSKEKAEQLAEMRDKMGLSKEAAEKIIKGVQNQHLIGNLQVRPSSNTPCTEALTALVSDKLPYEHEACEEL